MVIHPTPGFPLQDLGPLFKLNDARIAGFDGAYSIPLSDGCLLWYFGDTIIGQRQEGRSLWYPDGVRIGNRKMAGIGHITGMLTNSGIMTRSNGTLSFKPERGAIEVIRGVAGEARELVERTSDELDGDIRAWCLHGIEALGRIFLFYQLVRIVPEDLGLPICFEIVGSGLASGESASLSFDRITPHGGSGRGLWFPPEEPQFASAVTREGDWLYLYGIRKTGLAQECFLARVESAMLPSLDRWRYWDGTGWSRHVSTAVPLFQGPPNELSVSWNPYLGRWLAVHSIAMTGSIVARTAEKPEGPWSPGVPIADIEAGQERALPYPFLVYAAKEHPTLRQLGGKRICVTFVEFEEYWPHALTIDIGALL